MLMTYLHSPPFPLFFFVDDPKLINSINLLEDYSHLHKDPWAKIGASPPFYPSVAYLLPTLAHFHLPIPLVVKLSRHSRNKGTWEYWSTVTVHGLLKLQQYVGKYIIGST